MNESDSVANAVVNRQIDMLLEQERQKIKILPLLGSGLELSPEYKELILNIVSRMVVMMKISRTVRLN